jgi:CheY-like chemotaxis protein
MPADAPSAEVKGLQPGQIERRILVVEDNPENRLLLSTLLSRVGFRVREAENGEEAIGLFREWKPQLIMMDMRMPVMDGYEAARRIRELPGGDVVRIIAVSASALVEQRERILASGCDELVRKPYREGEIFDAVARQLGVEYRYGEAKMVQARKPTAELTAQMLAELPEGLHRELYEATVALDREGMMEVIGRIEEHAPETAQSLRELVDGYQMDRMHELLGEVS